MKQTVLILALGLAACGASPTTPTATVTRPQAQTIPDPPQPAEPPVTPPSPTPAPTPAPAPVPTPAPTPPARTVLHATVTLSHWYPDAAFTLPSSFDVVIEGDTAKIATLDALPFALYKSNEEFIVKQKDFEFVVQGGTFSFNGVAGQAAGSITVAK